MNSWFIMKKTTQNTKKIIMAKILKQQISPISKTHHQFAKPKQEKFNFSVQFRTKSRNQKEQTLNEIIRRRPASNGGGGHGFLLSQWIGELLDQLVEPVITRGEPIRGRSAHNDAWMASSSLCKRGSEEDRWGRCWRGFVGLGLLSEEWKGWRLRRSDRCGDGDGELG